MPENRVMMIKNAVVAQKIAERDFSTKKRAAMDLADFGDPEKRAFPIRSQADLDNAARLIGHADNPDAVKRRIIAIAKRKGLTLPASWQNEMDEKPKEAAVSTSTFKPKQRIAQIKSFFLENDAISLNGRQYPTSAVDKLIQSAQVQLSDPNALPLTCYLSHDKADQDSTRDIVGKITYVGREGNKAYALIDIPDTVAGRDAATLVAGGYIRSQSLRASGAEMYTNSESAYPLVGGAGLTLTGIDFTSNPGLPQVARITDVVTESHDPQALNELFPARPSSMTLLEQDEETMNDTITEEQIDPMAGGTTKGISDMGDPHDDYAKRQYPVPNVAMNGDAPIDQAIHDHISGAMNLECSKMTNAESKVARASLLEAGAKFNKAAKMHLMAAHDAVASKLGVECASGGTGKMASDGMQDGDDDDKPSERDTSTLINALRETMKPQSVPAKAKETSHTMTPQEAAQLLAEAGYKVEAPKSKEEQLQEQLAAMKSEFEAKLAEAQQAQLKELTSIVERVAPPKPVQRRSLVEGASEYAPGKPYYTNGSYLREKMNSLSAAELLDRSRPLPEGIDAERLLKEMYGPLLALYDEVYHFVA